MLRAKIYINNSRHLARKYARIFLCGHYLFLVAHSFPRAKLEENCELRGTDNVPGQISENIFAQMEAIVFIILQNFFATRGVLKTGEYLALINRPGGLYGRILTEVVSTDRKQ